MYRRIVSAAVLSTTLLATALASDPAPAPMQVASIDADTALAMLRDGNTRFVQGESTFPNLNQDRRCLTTDGGQHPYVSVLSCADSRVPPELLFDAGIGELFVIRVAGNVADTDEIGTLEYGAGHLNTPLILVMGHTKCGAVTAVVKKADVGGSIPKLVDNIIPAVETAREKYAGTPEAKFIQLAIKENVRQAMTDVLRNSEEIRHLVAADKVKIVGAVYDIHNGTIEWLGELPNQTAILDGAAAEYGDSHAPAAELLHGDTPDSHADAAHDAPKSSANDDQAVPAAKRVDPKDAAHDDPHAPPAKAADSHGSSAKKASSHDEPPKPAHGESTHDAPDDAHGSHNKSESDHSSDGEHGEEHAATVKKQSLVEKHGLLVPGAFLAAGSLLSGSIVFLLKGRAAHAAHSDDAHTDSKPTEKTPDTKPAEKKDAH
jgi:carbonic anhydrase